MSIVAQLVNQLVGVDGSVVDCRVDSQWYVIFGDNSLRSQIQHNSFQINLNNFFSPGIYHV